MMAAALAALTCQPALAQDTAPIVARAEQCLRQNVDRVVAAEPDIQSAASFLLDYACANEVLGAARYEKNLLTVARFGSMFKNVAIPPAAKSGHRTPPPPSLTATVDPETGDIVAAQPSADTTITFEVLAANATEPEPAPVHLRKLAGDLVLAAREQQLAKSH
jgi:hypothetical protein